LLEQEHTVSGQDLQQRLNVVERDDPAGRNPASTVRKARQLAPAFKERFSPFHTDFSHPNSLPSLLAQ
jgi:hypothetical protein